MALQTITVCHSIAALHVAGVSMLDIDQMPPDATRIAPCLFPEPVAFMTDFVMERDSYGGGSTALMTVTYDLHYTFLFAPIGAGRTGLDIYDEMLAKVTLILDAVLAVDVMNGTVDIQPVEVVELGPVPDPAGNQYLGCRMTFQVQEFVN